MVELDAWRIFVSTGSTPDSILLATEAQNTNQESVETRVPTGGASSFTFKHRWICAQCYKNGQIVERKGKTLYCASRGSHSWRDPMLYCHIGKFSTKNSIFRPKFRPKIRSFFRPKIRSFFRPKIRFLIYFSTKNSTKNSTKISTKIFDQFFD